MAHDTVPPQRRELRHITTVLKNLGNRFLFFVRPAESLGTARKGITRRSENALSPQLEHSDIGSDAGL